MANKLYQERQQYSDWLVISLLSLAIVGLLYGASTYFWQPGVTVAYAVVCVLLAAGIGYAIYWLTSLRSKLTVTDKNIKFRIKGAVEASKKIAWDDIVSCTLVKAPRLSKYNRAKVTLSDEKFYSLNGRNGLMIETNDGKRYFIGCENVEGLRAALEGDDGIWELTD